jgi:hypothetical protein
MIYDVSSMLLIRQEGSLAGLDAVARTGEQREKLRRVAVFEVLKNAKLDYFN